MYTMYGPEAKNGDYVLVQDVAYMKSSADIRVAQVHNGKAYAASAVPYKHGFRRWLRKETAIIVIPITEVSEASKKLIQMNIEAEKSTFDVGTEYFAEVWRLQNEGYEQERKEREERYGDK